MKKLLFVIAAIGVMAAILFAVPASAGTLDHTSIAALLSPDNIGAFSLIGFGMTTLAANTPRAYELGERNDFALVASTKVYEGAAVGIVVGTGLARPLQATDRFVGFAEYTCDSTTPVLGSNSLYYNPNVRVLDSGAVQLAVTGAVITDIGQPVYATDDNTFVFSPVASVFIGFVKRFVSAGVVIVDFDADCYRDPWGHFTSRATLSATATLDATSTGSLIWVDTDAFVITLPAIAAGLDGVAIVNGGAFGTILVSIAPNSSDMILGPGITGADNKAINNTKATAKRGDFVVLGGNDADGYACQALRGTWARTA